MGAYNAVSSKKEILLLQDPNELGCDKHGNNGWVNLSVINVSTESFLQYPDDPGEKGKISR